MVAETLNFSRAADALFITQPALSRHIAKIEEKMGAKLFDRDTRNMELTEAGLIVYDKFVEILNAYECAKDQIAILSSGNHGIIKIHSPYYWTADYTEPILLQFSAMYPNYTTQIISCQPLTGMEQMLNKESDLCLSMDVNVEPDINIECFPFTYEKLSVIMRADHSLSQKNYMKLEELKDHTLILLDGKSGYGKYNDLILNLLERRKIYPQKIVYTQQIDTVGLDVKKTNGICIMPYGVRHMSRDYIRTIPLEDHDCALPMCFYYRMDNNNSAIPVFLQVVSKVFQKDKDGA